MLAITRAGVACTWIAALASAQGSIPNGTEHPAPGLVCDSATRVADPKLPGGEARFTVRLTSLGTRKTAIAEVLAGGEPVAVAWTGMLAGGQPARFRWDGRDGTGARCPVGAYTLRVSAQGLDPLEVPFHLVRLGVTEIEALDGDGDEFQMVYFRKGPAYAYYATPATHEYRNAARPGELSDLDHDDGEPRAPVAVHLDTATPVLDAGNYDTSTHNYPLAYVMGASPRLELTLGASATNAGAGEATVAGYPVEGCDLRLVCDQNVMRAENASVSPGDRVVVNLAPLPSEVGSTEFELHLRWQWREHGELRWHDVPGRQTIPLRIYTLLGPPRFRTGASGTQYAGPWVEVAEYVCAWKETLGLPIRDQRELTNVFVHGFFGQNGGIPHAIEGVRYDAYPLGGDGGATHYVLGSNMQLSRLLHGHALGVFVNCTDNMGAATTMLSMLGAVNVRPLRLGSMNLRAIWGIGAPAYTLNLWGFGHGFSYHHIITDDGGVTVSDTCMQLDQDGSPTTLPGTPGWNTHRPWAGPGGYNDLSANNPVTRTVESLPGVQ